MGPNNSPHKPFLISGTLTNPPYSTCTPHIQSQLHGGLYSNDFLYYSSDPYHGEISKNLLQERVKGDFMGNGNYFLGSTFNWIQHDDGKISVHLCQLAFTEFTAHQFLFYTANKVQNMTPYSSGFTTDSILPVDQLYPDLTCCKQVYKSIIGCVNWLTTCTRPDISPVLKFLDSYSNSLYQQHYKAAFHALNYLTSTN